jgi:hypothetical protein
MEFMLLVTWFLGGNATSSYQVNFATRQACEVALSDLRNDARRLASSRDTMRIIGGAPQATEGTPTTDASPTPVLSAICINLR